MSTETPKSTQHVEQDKNSQIMTRFVEHEERLDHEDELMEPDYIKELVVNGKRIKEMSFRKIISEPNAIPEIDENPKYTEQMRDCTGIVVVGVSLESGKNISFMLHVNTGNIENFNENEINEFIKSVGGFMDVFISKTLSGKVDAVIFGGQVVRPWWKKGEKGEKELANSLNEYKNAIRIWNKILENKLGHSCLVIAGPKDDYGNMTVYFDTKNRRLYLKRESSKNPVRNESFLASDIDSQGNKYNIKHKD